MKDKIIVLGNFAQRINDQLIFLNNLNLNKEINFIFLIDRLNNNLLNEIKNNNYEIVYLDKDNISNKIFISDKGQSFYKIINPFSFLKNIAKKNIYLFKIVSFLLKIFRSLSFYQIYKEKVLLKEFNSDYKKASNIFKELKPKFLLVSSDRHAGFEPAVLKSANDNNIKIIILYLAYTGEDWFSRYTKCEYRNSFFSSIYSHIIFNRFKDQRLKYRGKLIYFYNSYTLSALYKFGVLSKFPWIMGNGISDIVCIDNMHNYERYKQLKVPENKLKIIGDYAIDIVYRNYLNKNKIKINIINKYDLIDDKIIICALPQLAEHKICNWKTHWKEIEFLIDSISRNNSNILISLHPKMNISSYRYLENKFNCKILNERLHEVICIADVFISTYSSTLLWAILCGINSIVIDFYNLNFTMYDFLKSIIIVKDKNYLEDVLSKSLKIKSDFSEDWKILSRKETFDGRSMQRYSELLTGNKV